MINVTEIFEKYRECSRHLRNTYFSTIHQSRRSPISPTEWDIIEDFDAVDEVLFQCMVLERLPTGQVLTPTKDNMSEFLRLVPSESWALPVMISRDRDAKSGSWDHPVTRLAPGEAEIAFEGYFDWDQFALIDMQYYRGKILASQKYPEIVGHTLFIEIRNAEVQYCQENKTEKSDTAI